jgi:hypothetical protein
MLDTFFVNAPEGDRWPLDIDTLDQHLQERFPGMNGWIRHAPVLSQDYLDFDVVLEGSRRAGSYYAGGPLILNDGDAEDWAPTIAWFLSLLPLGTPAVVMRESDPEEIVPLPADPSPAQIQQILEQIAPE